MVHYPLIFIEALSNLGIIKAITVIIVTFELGNWVTEAHHYQSYP